LFQNDGNMTNFAVVEGGSTAGRAINAHRPYAASVGCTLRVLAEAFRSSGERRSCSAHGGEGGLQLPFCITVCSLVFHSMPISGPTMHCNLPCPVSFPVISFRQFNHAHRMLHCTSRSRCCESSQGCDWCAWACEALARSVQRLWRETSSTRACGRWTSVLRYPSALAHLINI
jgi:hypothetical protein